MPVPYDVSMPNGEDTMQEELNTPTSTWIERCARRLQFRHMVPAPDAMEIASLMHDECGPRSCPERAAEELFMPGELH
jgi:hypothetical protein